MKQQLESIRQQALSSLNAAATPAELDELRVKWLGKKGELTAVLKLMGKLSPEERPVMGQLANAVRAEIEETLEKRKTAIDAAVLEQKLAAESIDVTIPGAAVADGTALIWSDEKDENGMPLLLHTYTYQDTNLDDMLYATAHVEDATADQGPVNFTFNHLLSKVHFTVTSTAEGDYYHTVTGIKVANYSSGTYAITTDTWTGKTAKDVPFADIAEVTDMAAQTKKTTKKPNFRLFQKRTTRLSKR